MKRFLPWLLVFVACFVALSAIAGHGRDRGHARPPALGRRSPAARGASNSTDLDNNFVMNVTGSAGSYVHITPHDVALDPTDRVTSFVRVVSDSPQATRVLISKDDDANQRSFGLDLVSIVGNHGAVRLYQCGTLSACSNTRVTGTGAFRNAVGTSAAFHIDHTRQLGIVYVDGAAVNITNTNAITTPAPAASTSRWTIGAKHGGAGTTEFDGRLDDWIIWIDPADIGANAWSLCMWELHNRRGSRTIPSSCPTPDFWCRGGDDDAGTGTTCTNFMNPGTYDATLVSATFEANTEINKLEDLPTLTVADSAVQVAACIPAQSNCTGNNLVSDLGAGQTDEYPNFADILIYGNDGTRELGSSTPQPVDRNWSGGRTWSFVQSLDDSTGTFTDELTDWGDTGNADVLPFPATEAVDDALYLGLPARFMYVRIDNANGTAGVGGTVAWEYCSANAVAASACDTWTAVSGLSDATVGFTAAAADSRVVTWTHPSNWALSTLNGSAQLYFVRARVTQVYTTNPVLDQGFSAQQSNIYATGDDSSADVSPMAAFCDEVLETFSTKTCGLIPTARGGSALAGSTASDNWTPQHGTQETRLWGEAMHRITDDIDSNAEFAVFLNYQGEAEVNAIDPAGGGTWPTDWASYNHRFRTVAAIEAARDHLVASGVTGGRAVPVIVTILPETAPTGYDTTEWLLIRTGQALIPTMTNDAVTVQVPAGFATVGDEVHQTAAGADAIGRLWGDAFETTRWFGALTP